MLLAGTATASVAATATTALGAATTATVPTALATVDGCDRVGVLRRLQNGDRTHLPLGVHCPKAVSSDRQIPRVGVLVVAEENAQLGRQPL